MTSTLPARFARSSLAPRSSQPAKAARMEQRAVTMVHRHDLNRWVMAQQAVIDVSANELVIGRAVEIELSFYDEYVGRVRNSAVKAEIFARRMEQLSSMNSRSISEIMR